MEETIFQCSQGDLEEFHFPFPEQNCNSMRPVVKLEDAEAKGPGAEAVQEETVAGRAVQAPSRGRSGRCG